MKQLFSLASRRTGRGGFLVVCLFLLASLGWGFGQVMAQTVPSEVPDAPKNRPVEVTAIVPVTTSPPVPILIAPGKGITTRQRRVTFKWRLPEHTVPYDYVDLSVDGQRLLAHLPLHDRETDEYELTVEDWEFTLQLKAPLALEEGLHTWKVRSIDINDRGTDSTTWSFTIDSQSPTILLTQVEEQEWAISSADPLTVPTEPITVTTHSPALIGQTEANIPVQLAIIHADGTEMVLEATSDINGAFGFQLSDLPPDEVVTLRFSAVDNAGNATLLEGVRLQYVPQKIVIVIPIPPGIFPDPLTIELPPWNEPIRWSEILLPEPVAQAIEPILTPVQTTTASFTDLMATFITQYSGLMASLVLLLASFYLFVLWWLAGNPWSSLVPFVGQWLRAWFFGWPHHPHQWREDEKRQLVPLLAFELEQYDQASQTLHRVRRFTTLAGEWNLPATTEQLESIRLTNRHLRYPSTTVTISEERPLGSEARRLWLTGESWFRVDNRGTARTSAEAFVLETAQPYILVVWGHWSNSRPSPVWRWLPRGCLVIGWSLAFALLVVQPTAWTVTLFLLVFGMLIRDVQWRVPQAWKVYTS